MFNRPLRISKDYQIIPKSIHTDLATNAIEYCFKDFPVDIPQVWAHEDIYSTIYRQRRQPGEPQKNF